MFKPVNLAEVAQNVGLPSRKNCGACHFYGGGGDGVKHGDLDSSLFSPDKKLDVHMAVNGPNFACTACHTTVNHHITGRYYSDPAPVIHKLALPKDYGNRISCESCHSASPHKESKLNDHTDKVACQTCHIPRYARGGVYTKMWWDWSTAGRFDENGKMIVKKAANGTMTYHTKKGSMRWAKNVKPDYAWYNGKMDYLSLSDSFDDSKPVSLNRIEGSYGDPKARIFPFKIYRGKQVYDPVRKKLVIPKLFGKKGSGAFWGEYDWNKAVAAGMREAGEPYSGKIGFVETKMFWPITHMVAPKEEALACDECHSRNGRLANLTGFYMPGRDRSKGLDTLGWVMTLLILIGTVIHAAMRISRRNKVNKEQLK